MPFNKDIDNIRGLIHHQEARFLYELAGKIVAQFGDNSILCEIGSFCGRSTVSIASALKERGAGILYAIDWHQGSRGMPGFDAGEYPSTYEEFMNNLEKFAVKERIRIINGKSEDSVTAVPERLHFLWIDGAHDYDAVKADFDHYARKITKGGYLLFHDACWTDYRGPFEVIEKEVLDNPDYTLYACIGNTMVFRKTPDGLSSWKRYLLRQLFRYTCGEYRSLPQKILSFGLFRLTMLWTIWRHNGHR